MIRRAHHICRSLSRRLGARRYFFINRTNCAFQVVILADTLAPAPKTGKLVADQHWQRTDKVFRRSLDLRQITNRLQVPMSMSLLCKL